MTQKLHRVFRTLRMSQWIGVSDLPIGSQRHGLRPSRLRRWNLPLRSFLVDWINSGAEIKVIYNIAVGETLIKTATCKHNSGTEQLMIQLPESGQEARRLVVTMKYISGGGFLLRHSSVSRMNQINELLTRTKCFAENQPTRYIKQRKQRLRLTEW